MTADMPADLIEFAFAASPMVFFTGDLDDSLALDYLSANCHGIIGIHPGDLLGPHALQDAVSEAGRPHLEAGVQALRRLGRAEGPLALRDEQDLERWFTVCARVRLESGVLRVQGCLQRLQARPEASTLRRATHSLSRLLIDALDQVPSALGLLDADGRLILCNAAFAGPYGLPSGALVGMDQRQLARAFLTRVVRIDDREMTGSEADVTWWAARLAHADAPPAEVEMADGQWKLVNATAIANGGLIVTRTDISSRKRIEVALRERESLVRQVLEACPAPVSMVRLDTGEILYENPASMALFGDDRSSDDGSSTQTPVTASGLQRVRAYSQSLRGADRVDGLEIELARGDGSHFPVSLSARLIEYRGTDVVVASALDLSERREMEEELSRQREALYRTEKLSALGELLASVAHELNNPLSVVVGQAMLMQETITDPRVVERAEKIGEAASRCSRILKAFQAIARQQPVARTLLDVNEVLEEALELCASMLRDAQIQTRCRLAARLPPINADRNQLVQVLTQLVLNARHALLDVHEGRELKITSGFRARTGEVTIKVKDNGPGVPEDLRQRIFEPLFTTQEVGAASGLGLALCHRVVVAHGGMLDLENGTGPGAVFCIRLPAATTEDVGTSADPSRGGIR
ncbi:MAG: PAS domain S-box protein [Gammaproteobacteria bacterium]|nr:PAS domain S-box protein [Gammaproteobacteria bacterium]